MQAVERVVTVAAGPELPELAPGTPKFILQQVKDMERLLCRIEKEDSYDMFRTARDPIEKLKGTGEYQEDQENVGGGGNSHAMCGWLAPERGRDSGLGGGGGRGLTTTASGQQQEAGANGEAKRASPSTDKTSKSSPNANGDDTGSSGGGGSGAGQASRKRPRKGAAAAAEDAMEVEEAKEDVKPEQQAMVKGDDVVLSDKEEKESAAALCTATKPPINLPQIRERFVSGYYIPPPGSYLILAEEPPYGEASTTATTYSGADGAAATASASTAKNRGTAVGAAGATAVKRLQKKGSSSKSRPTCSPVPTKEEAKASAVTVQTPAAADNASKTTVTTSVSTSSPAAGGGVPPPSPCEEIPPVKEKQKDATVLALTRDSGRLGEEAKLTFEYEPLLDWACLRADVAGMVSRMLKGAEDWQGERERERNQRRQRRRRRRCRGGSGGGSGDDSGGGGEKEEGEGGDDDEEEEEEDEGVEDYLERARKFSATADDFVTKQIERAEKDVCTAVYYNDCTIRVGVSFAYFLSPCFLLSPTPNVFFCPSPVCQYRCFVGFRLSYRRACCSANCRFWRIKLQG